MTLDQYRLAIFSAIARDHKESGRPMSTHATTREAEETASRFYGLDGVGLNK